MKLSPLQAYVLLQISDRGYTTRRAQAKALIANGLVHDSFRRYERYEWGRCVASIACYSLSAEGAALVSGQLDQLKALRAQYLAKLS